jgi:inorganic pyrophosphatase
VDEPLLCIVEIPKGSRNKYEYDADLGLMVFDRFLSARWYYRPTTALSGAPTPPTEIRWTYSSRCRNRRFPVAPCTPSRWPYWGLCDQDEREPKVVCAPCEDPNWKSMEDLADLPKQLVEEIAHFFVAYQKREDHEVTVDGWGGADEARKVVEEGFARG